MVIEGVLLDFYGTVVHEDDVLLAEMRQEIAAAADQPTDPATVGSLWWQQFSSACAAAHGSTFETQRSIERAALRSVCVEVGASCDVDALSQRLFDHWSQPPAFADALDFLAALRVPVVVISNIDRIDIEAAVAHHDLIFDDVITSEDVRSYKPRPDLFHAGLASLGMRARDVLHIGDSVTSDVAGATALGIPVAWVNRTQRPMPEWPGQRAPDHVVSTLTELLPLVS